MALDPNMIAAMLSPPAGAVLAQATDPDEQRPAPVPVPPPPQVPPPAPPVAGPIRAGLPGGPPLVPPPQPQYVALPAHEPSVYAALANLQRMHPASDPDSLDTDVAKMAFSLDRVSGAPADVRAAVAGVVSPTDRLRTIRARFPLAVPVEGTNNFVYLDPDTGDPVLFDEDRPPPGAFAQVSAMFPGLSAEALGGLRMRDVLDFLPGLGEAAGMVVGGAVGGGLGIPTGPGALAATAAGAGMGAATGRRVAQNALQTVTGAEDTRGAGEQARQDLAAATMGAGSALVGPAAGAVLGRVGNAAARARLLTPRSLRASVDKIDEAVRASRASGGTGAGPGTELVAMQQGDAAKALYAATRMPTTEAPGAVARLRAAASDDDWLGVADNLWVTLSDDGTRAGVDVLTKNLGALPPPVRAELFRGTPYADAARSVQGLESVGRARNLAPAAEGLWDRLKGTTLLLAGAAMGGAAGGISGGVVGGLAGRLAQRATRSAVPRVLASARFNTWLRRAVDGVSRSPGALPSYLLRLPAIAEVEPEIDGALRTLFPEAFDPTRAPAR